MKKYLSDTIRFKGELYIKEKYHIQHTSWVIHKQDKILKTLYKTRDNLEAQVTNLKLKNTIYKTKLETIKQDLDFILKD